MIKRGCISFLLGCLTLSLFAQKYNVSTEVQHQNVLLEEFTGMRCGYCPDGHKLAANMKTVLGERLSVVNIHCGYFAIAGSYEPDYIVEDGEVLGDFLGGSTGSFPSASISRHDWEKPGYLLCRRGWWQEYTEKRMQEVAPVNLWSKVVYDLPSHKMSVRVEGYFSAEEVAPTQRLNVLLVQNNVLGLQYGGSMGDKYPHQHMLRDAITDALGDELTDCRAGSYFVREYEYQVPEKFKDVPVDPTNLELVVFVTNAEKLEVQNVITVKPEYVGEVLPLKAVVAKERIGINEGYGYPYFPVVLTNQCNSTLTAATFRVSLNGESVEMTWTGEMAPFATQEIRLPVDWNNAAGKESVYQVALTGLNGEAFAGNVLEGSFGEKLSVPTAMKMKVCTNYYAKENRYTLYNGNGQVVRTFGPYESEQGYEEELLLEGGRTYCLEMANRWGSNYFPNGPALELYDKAGHLLKSVMGYEGFGYRLFLETPEVTGVDAVQAADEAKRIYDRSGRLVSVGKTVDQLEKGVYIVRKGKNVEKIVIR